MLRICGFETTSLLGAPTEWVEMDGLGRSEIGVVVPRHSEADMRSS